jgi:hypothetical protein
MNTRTSAKLAALAVALVMNSMIVGGVGYLFDIQIQRDAATQSQNIEWSVGHALG